MPHRRKAFILYVIAISILLRIESFIPNFGKCPIDLQSNPLCLSTNDNSFSANKIENFEWINNNLIPSPISDKYSQSSIFNSIVDYDVSINSPTFFPLPNLPLKIKLHTAKDPVDCLRMYSQPSPRNRDYSRGEWSCCIIG
jgi:hypothetical protein